MYPWMFFEFHSKMNETESLNSCYKKFVKKTVVKSTAFFQQSIAALVKA